MRPETYGRIAERAQDQLGLVCWRDLRELDVRSDAFRRLVDRGEWDARCPHVFRHRASPRTWRQDVVGALLDAPPGGLATALTAARVWDVPGYERCVEIDVLVKRGRHHALCGDARLHETFWLPESHRATRHGVDVVAVRRLPFELAAVLRPSSLRWVIDFCRNEHGLELDDLALTVAELCRSGRPGSAQMRLQLEELAPGYVPPASALEAAYRDLCQTFGLPPGVRQHDTGGDAWIGRVDVAYPEAKLLVELDSRRWHNTRDGFESDRTRTNELVAAGWRVVRITWRMLHDEPERVAALIRSLLAAADPRLCDATTRKTG